MQVAFLTEHQVITVIVTLKLLVVFKGHVTFYTAVGHQEIIFIGFHYLMQHIQNILK